MTMPDSFRNSHTPFFSLRPAAAQARTRNDSKYNTGQCQHPHHSRTGRPVKPQRTHQAARKGRHSQHSHKGSRMRVLKSKWSDKWTTGEILNDETLLAAVAETEGGRVDARQLPGRIRTFQPFLNRPWKRGRTFWGSSEGWKFSCNPSQRMGTPQVAVVTQSFCYRNSSLCTVY